MATPTSKIQLKTTHDWVLWIDQLQSKAESYELWEDLDPDRFEKRPRATTRYERRTRRPIRPEISDHPKTGKAELLRADADDDLRAEGLADLSAANLALYKERRTEYMEQLKEYESLMKGVRSLEDWIRETVDADLLRHCCTADKKLDQWIHELKTRAGCDSQERRAIANEAYKRVLLTPERKRLGTKKDVEDWLAKWEQAFHEAEASGVPGLDLSSLWFPEFIRALSHSYADTWVFSYQATTKRLAKRDELTPGEVLRDARQFTELTNKDEALAIAAAFQYEALPDEKAYIRLLEVQELDTTAIYGVRCQLTAWPLEHAPGFHAVSYTWGDPEQTTFIHVNGKLLEVRRNCEYALKQAGCHGGTRFHWVDAICINQGDHQEKSHQVQMMGRIFKSADLVLACATLRTAKVLAPVASKTVQSATWV
ncbi:gag protein [Colletotrichum plurivorum]|uniref:Gag protein n=1 Tax=Colletotrichum plurivorum TaxID=2175906 RepID=A0A8H6MV17_9PEZI|nr:gag protein [Colletotrichum plurivorum]